MCDFIFSPWILHENNSIDPKPSKITEVTIIIQIKI